MSSGYVEHEEVHVIFQNSFYDTCMGIAVCEYEYENVTVYLLCCNKRNIHVYFTHSKVGITNYPEYHHHLAKLYINQILIHIFPEYVPETYYVIFSFFGLFFITCSSWNTLVF